MSKWISVFLSPTRTSSSLLLPLLLLLLLWGTMYTGTATAHPSAFLLNALGVVADATAAVVADDQPPTSHISDYRLRPRSDSRADKPDSFPGFDAAGEVRSPSAAASHAAAAVSQLLTHTSTAEAAAQASPSRSVFATMSSRPARQRQRAANTEFYAQLVAKLIGNIGVGNIIDGVERKQDKLQRLRRLKQLKAAFVASAVRGAVGSQDNEDDDDGDADDDGGGDEDVVQVISVESTTATAEKTATATTTVTPPPAAAAMSSVPRRLADAFRVPAVFAIPASYVSSLWTNYMLPNQLRNTFGLADQSVAADRAAGGRRAQKPANTSTVAHEAPHKNAKIIAAAAHSSSTVSSSSNGTRDGGGETALNWLSSPLRGIWHSATKNLYVNRPNPIPTRSSSIRITDEQQQHEQQQQRQHHEFANDTGINVHHPSGMPNRQSAAAPPTEAPPLPSSIDDGNGTNSTRLARAKLAFLHAFYKYSQRMSTQNYNVSIGSNKNNTTSGAAGAAAARVTADIRAQTTKTATAMYHNDDDAGATQQLLAAAEEDVTAAGASPSSTLPPTFDADEFDANLNINDNVVAVGLAAERIAQLYGYRANNHAATTATAASTVHNTNTTTADAADAITSTAAAADGSNQPQRQNDQHHGEHERRRRRHERLRRVGERFIAGGGAAKAGTAGAQRRSFASPLATDRDNNDDDDDDVDNGSSAGSTSSSSGGGMVAEVAESVGIFVLEILGTIAGLGWGAFTYLQSLIYA